MGLCALARVILSQQAKPFRYAGVSFGPQGAIHRQAQRFAGEALALAALLGGRLLPGCGFLARPVEAVVHAGGPAAVPALTCGGAAIGLLVHATAVLSRASAHTT